MSSPLSLVKRLRIFVSHPHVEWHETSTALGTDALKEINDTRRQRKLRAKRARERQAELQGLRQAIEGRNSLLAQQSSGLKKTPSSIGHSLAALSGATTETDKAFMSTQEAAPAIGAPFYVHTGQARASVAFANTTPDGSLFATTQSMGTAVQATPRRVRIAGYVAGTSSEGANGTLPDEAHVAANDQSRNNLPEALQAAAVCLAVGDKTAARAQLKAALAQAPDSRVFAQAWLECLRACDEREAFLAAVKAFAELHQFELPAFYFYHDKNTVVDRPQVSQATPAQALERLTVPAEMDLISALAFKAKVQGLAQRSAQSSDVPDATNDADAVHALFSFVRLNAIRAEAMPALAQALTQLNSCPARFVLQGGTVLLDLLLSYFSTQRSTPAREAWDAALQACRLLNRADKYDALFNAYGNQYIVDSPNDKGLLKDISGEYAWKPSVAKFITFHRTIDDTADLAFSIEPTDADANASPGFGDSQSSQLNQFSNNRSNQDSLLPALSPYAQPISQASRAVSLRLQGQGTHERVVRVLEMVDSAAKGYNAVSIDMTQTQLLRFDAAVALLNWAERKREQGIAVKLHGQGLLIQALFEQISMGDVADLVPAYL